MVFKLLAFVMFVVRVGISCNDHFIPQVTLVGRRMQKLELFVTFFILVYKQKRCHYILDGLPSLFTLWLKIQKSLLRCLELHWCYLANRGQYTQLLCLQLSLPLACMFNYPCVMSHAAIMNHKASIPLYFFFFKCQRSSL